jgi:hypothetical protein
MERDNQKKKLKGEELKGNGKFYGMFQIKGCDLKSNFFSMMSLLCFFPLQLNFLFISFCFYSSSTTTVSTLDLSKKKKR